ncbi:MAG: hypothetical protein UX25_C0052G0001 [Candidatus Woesebacteria bacterium GW2011_GWC2_45_9]|uniref:Uncharacterized protein n=2 Tax=Microgenomates group TaxID=1794810 RepID=A0A0G1N5K7_9BACT|nr:MAG: hypothetical protein UW61_C0011G0014 [Candidatus Curtissbacteria bacterium GW2011_GWC1_44_33]KKU15839.1 MAG: hypothetical protein UX25_C0052G0001 [Candidatus Woesebacteria bacterium GW2011_GWC2_45_9]
MLQSILDGQTLIRKDIKGVKEEAKKTELRLTERIDKLGLQLANLEDDSPTIEEFDGLEKRVSKLEKHAASV